MASQQTTRPRSLPLRPHEGSTLLYETANLLVARSWFERVGGFEPWLAPRRSKELAEDVWLGWRIRRAGARVAFAAEAVVEHAVFPGTPASYVAERARLRFFPAIAGRIPELREDFFYRRVFMNRRTAAFDDPFKRSAVRLPTAPKASRMAVSR